MRKSKDVVYTNAGFAGPFIDMILPTNFWESIGPSRLEALHRLVADPKTPYRTLGDFLVDAVGHEIAQLKERFREPDNQKAAPQSGQPCSIEERHADRCPECPECRTPTDRATVHDDDVFDWVCANCCQTCSLA